MSLRLEPYWLLGLALAAGIAIVLTGEKLGDVETVEALQGRLRLNPNDPALHERLANALLRDQRPTAALTHYDVAILADRNNTSAPYGKATALVVLNRSRDAQDVLKASLKDQPNNARNNEFLADLLVQSLASLGDDVVIPATEKYYETALRNDPTRPHAAVAMSKRKLAQGDTDAAGRILERPLQSHPRDAGLNLQMAAVLTALKQYNAAQTYFEKGTALDPKNAAAYCDYGVMLITAGRSVAAERVLRTSLDLDPKSPRTHVELGRALRDLAQMNLEPMESAMKEFEAASKINDRYAPAYYETARTYLVQRNESAAKQFFQEAVNRDPTYADALIELARLQRNSSDPTVRDPAEGLNTLREAVLATRWKNIELMMAYARALAGDNHFDSAVDVLDRALALPTMSPVERELFGERRLAFLLRTLPPADEKGLPLDLLLPLDPLGGAPWPRGPRAPVNLGQPTAGGGQP